MQHDAKTAQECVVDQHRKQTVGNIKHNGCEVSQHKRVHTICQPIVDNFWVFRVLLQPLEQAVSHIGVNGCWVCCTWLLFFSTSTLFATRLPCRRRGCVGRGRASAATRALRCPNQQSLGAPRAPCQHHASL